MIGLHRRNGRPKPRPRRPRERRANGRKHLLRAQARKAPSRPHRHVNRMTLRVLGPRDVWHPGAFACRLAPRQVSPSSPSSEGERKMPIDVPNATRKPRGRRATSNGRPAGPRGSRGAWPTSITSSRELPASASSRRCPTEPPVTSRARRTSPCSRSKTARRLRTRGAGGLRRLRRPLRAPASNRR